eukprot:4469410-Pleurochrysis_carterae.AAC.3
MPAPLQPTAADGRETPAERASAAKSPSIFAAGTAETPVPRIPSCAAACPLCSHLLCPITLARMDDPICAPDGHTYERSALQRWLGQRPGRRISPVRAHTPQEQASNPIHSACTGSHLRSQEPIEASQFGRPAPTQRLWSVCLMPSQMTGAAMPAGALRPNFAMRRLIAQSESCACQR